MHKIFYFCGNKINRHSEGAERLWESPLLLLKLKVEDRHEPMALAMTKDLFFALFGISCYICGVIALIADIITQKV